MQVAAVARVPPTRLQFMVAPEWDALGEGGMDVPGLKGVRWGGGVGEGWGEVWKVIEWGGEIGGRVGMV